MMVNCQIITRFEREILPYFPPPLKKTLASLAGEDVSLLQEIRLRTGQPLSCRIGNFNYWLNSAGQKGHNPLGEPWLVGHSLMEKVVASLTASSFYAFEQELAQGYLTLPGGHRVGFCGEAVLEQGRLKTLRYLTSLNFRLAREIKGCADALLPYLWHRDKQRVYQSLIVSPPGAGKTTLLRDVIRQLSDGVQGIFPGQNIGLVDERSELAAAFRGIPQNDVGCRTDVLTGCGKGEGMMLLLRSMAPDIIAIDELGRAEDAHALLDVMNAGVAVIATVHGQNWQELRQRPTLGRLIDGGIFARFIFLSKRRGPGTIEKVLNRDGEPVATMKQQID